MIYRLFWLLLLPLFTACVHPSGDFQDEKLEARAGLLKGQTQPRDFKRIVFFGDSFTDNEGRLLHYTHGIIPTTAYYWKGRFSNGPVWSDYLIQALGLPAINYAMAGARIKDKNAFGVPGDSIKLLEVPGAGSQIELFVKEHKRFQPEDLVFVWFGSNDYLFYADPARVPTYVDQVMEVTERMIALGGRTVMVMALIPFDDVPLDPKGIDGKNFDRQRLEGLIDEHNQGLQKRVKALAQQHPEIQLRLIAPGAFIRGIRKSASAYGLTNLKEPCFGGGVVLGSNSGLVRLFQSDRKPLVCDHPAQHLFWDKAHPTTGVHCLAAVHVLDSLQNFQMISGFDAIKAESLCVDRESACVGRSDADCRLSGR